MGIPTPYSLHQDAAGVDCIVGFRSHCSTAVEAEAPGWGTGMTAQAQALQGQRRNAGPFHGARQYGRAHALIVGAVSISIRVHWADPFVAPGLDSLTRCGPMRIAQCYCDLREVQRLAQRGFPPLLI